MEFIVYQFNTVRILFLLFLAEKQQEEENQNENEYEEPKEYEEILPICLEVLSPALQVTNDQELSREMNGIEKFSCQTIVYTKV